MSFALLDPFSSFSKVLLLLYFGHSLPTPLLHIPDAKSQNVWKCRTAAQLFLVPKDSQMGIITLNFSYVTKTLGSLRAYLEILFV